MAKIDNNYKYAQLVTDTDGNPATLLVDPTTGRLLIEIIADGDTDILNATKIDENRQSVAQAVSAAINNTGAISPGTAINVAVPGVDWANPTNVLTSNNSYATFYASVVAAADNIECVDWEVKIVKSDDSIGTTNKKETDVVWGTSDAYTVYGSSFDLWGETWTPADINNSNFGIVIKARIREITDLDVYNTSDYLKATNFGFSISSDATITGIKIEIEKKVSTSLNEGIAFIDHIRITVYYTIGEEETIIRPLLTNPDGLLLCDILIE